MELEDLKSAWKSVRPRIEPTFSEEEASHIVRKQTNAKSRLLKRTLWSSMLLLVSLILMATSHWWALMKFPVWWIGAFCMMIVVEILCNCRLYWSIRNINLGEDSNIEVLSAVIGIKKLYRNMELVIMGGAIPLLIWISLSPAFVNSWRMVFVWCLTLMAIVGEVIWYRSYMKQLNNLMNWKNL